MVPLPSRCERSTDYSDSVELLNRRVGFGHHLSAAGGLSPPHGPRRASDQVGVVEVAESTAVQNQTAAPHDRQGWLDQPQHRHTRHEQRLRLPLAVRPGAQPGDHLGQTGGIGEQVACRITRLAGDEPGHLVITGGDPAGPLGRRDRGGVELDPDLLQRLAQDQEQDLPGHARGIQELQPRPDTVVVGPQPRRR